VNRSIFLPLFERHQQRSKHMATKSGGSKRGFAAMDPAKQREIASKGGKASHGGGRKASGSR
jgi:general stress protein YciG